MTGPSRPRLHACVPVHAWETMPPELKAIATAMDAPYAQMNCPRCRQPMLVSQQAQAMLKDGRAESAICTDCIVSMVKSHDWP